MILSYNRKSLLYSILVITFLFVIFFFYYSLQKHDQNGMRVKVPIAIGKQLPVIRYPDTGYNGAIFNGFTKSDLQENEISVLNIWASWCTPCRAEHEILMKIKDQDIPVYGINYRDKLENAVKFLDELGNPFTGLGFDFDGVSAITLGVYGIPETYVIDSNGVVLNRHIGPLTTKELEEISSFLNR